MGVTELVALAAIATAAGIPIGWVINAKVQPRGVGEELQRALVRIETRLALLPTFEELDRVSQREEAAKVLAVIDLLRADVAEIKKAGQL